VDEANATLGEKIELRRFATFEGGYVAAYLHKTSPDLPAQVGVLVQLDKENAETAKDVAQHIAAFAPNYLTRADIPAEVVENERRLAEETSREEGKPEAALPKIVEGRVNGFFKENVSWSRPSPRTRRDGPEGARRGRGHPAGLRPLPGRRLSRSSIGPEQDRTGNPSPGRIFGAVPSATAVSSTAWREAAPGKTALCSSAVAVTLRRRGRAARERPDR